MLGDHEEHRAYEDFAVRHVMGGLDEAESGAFRSHMMDCVECRARVGELRSIASELAEVERVERRERAAQRVETKERETRRVQDPREMPTSPPRGLKIVVAVGMFLVVVLSIWNFVLRGQVEGLRGVADGFVGAAETINFGDRWAAVDVGEGIEGVARELDGKLAVMVRGVEDPGVYWIRGYDEVGESRLNQRLDRPHDGQVWWYGDWPDDVIQVQVTRRRGDGDTIVFRADAP